MPDTGRLRSLDVMRGATVLAMILVNNPGDWGALYWPLRHADWHGWTPTDLVFPFFLFMVGVAMAYSFAKYVSDENSPSSAVAWRVGRRVLVLFALGLLLNGSGDLYALVLGDSASFDLTTLRIPGVLQRIALAYLGASAVVLLLGARAQAVAGVVLLVGYGAVLLFLPSGVSPEARIGEESNAVRQVDAALVGQRHMWSQRPTDPEGLLSTLPAIVTTLSGYGVGRFLRRRPIGPAAAFWLLGVGAIAAAAGQAAGYGPLPINKALWTPPFVLLTSGLAMTALALCLLLFDVYGRGGQRVARLASPFSLVGENAIVAYAASSLFGQLLSSLRLGGLTAKESLCRYAIEQPLNAAGLTDPRLASLVYAVLFVALWWAALAVMHRRGWVFRV